MLIAKKQQEIESLRSKLTEETAAYRHAINQDMKLELVKPLYQKVKATMKELKTMMEEYDKLITDNMDNYKEAHEK